jgi:hypothetical protein
MLRRILARIRAWLRGFSRADETDAEWWDRQW